MTSRRIVKTNQDVKALAPSVAEKKHEQFGNVPKSVVAKLLFFTFSMISGPLLSYYASNTFIFPGNSTAAAAIAVVVANLVLIGYLIAAIAEDDSDQKEEKKVQ